MPSIAERVAGLLRERDEEGDAIMARLVEARGELGRLRYGADLTRDTPDLGAHM